jgi:hypothetical protein
MKADDFTGGFKNIVVHELNRLYAQLTQLHVTKEARDLKQFTR